MGEKLMRFLGRKYKYDKCSVESSDFDSKNKQDKESLTLAIVLAASGAVMLLLAIYVIAETISTCKLLTH